MQALALRLRPIWPYVTFLASGALLAGAHAFERIGGLTPCPLCLDQRDWHWGVLTASAIGAAVTRLLPARAWIAAALIGLVYVGAAGMAGYHVAVEQKWVVAQCDVRIDLDAIQPMSLEGELTVPRCDTPAWTMFGLSMAGYNMLISLGLMLASFVVAFAPSRKE